MRSHLHRLLEELVLKEIDKIKEAMADGIGDNSLYWRSVGTIDGLKGALRLCSDIERDPE